MSIHDFNGQIELLDNTISQNMVFMPSAIYSNYPKYNQTDFNISITDFILNNENQAPIGDEPVSSDADLFFKVKSPHFSVVKHDIHFLNYYDHDKHSEILKKKFKTMSCIFIENTQAKHLVFEGNTFSNNIGLHGGAVHINNQLIMANDDSLRRGQQGGAGELLEKPKLRDMGSPVILFKDNTFLKNMAYFEGNAIYIKGHQPPQATEDESAVNIDTVMGQVYIQENQKVG